VLQPMLVELAKVQRQLRAMLAEAAGGNGIGPSHLAVLDALRSRTRMTGAELARAASITPQAMNEVVRRLEQYGEVRREPHPVDKRKIEYEITPAGSARVERSHAAERLLETRITEWWSSERQDALLQELRAVNDDLARALGPSEPPDAGERV
jgi:DNA-binding MarR family transcriptional regulator